MYISTEVIDREIGVWRHLEWMDDWNYQLRYTENNKVNNLINYNICGDKILWDKDETWIQIVSAIFIKILQFLYLNCNLQNQDL